MTQLLARDLDNDPLVFGVVGEEASRFFAVESVTGVVWLRQPLDREVRQLCLGFSPSACVRSRNPGIESRQREVVGKGEQVLVHTGKSNSSGERERLGKAEGVAAR